VNRLPFIPQLLSTGLLGRRRNRIVAGLILLAVLAAAFVAVSSARSPNVRVSSRFVAATPEDGVAVSLDTSTFLPDQLPAPAILLAHGFGGTKDSVAAQAKSLARHGYVVMTYTARGFGASGGDIHLDSLDYEVADAHKLVDVLATMPQVQQRNGKPVIGVAGSSYGGGLALMLAATDQRIGAVAADITWNDLAQSLFANTASGGAASTGVFKKLWAGYLFADAFGGDVSTPAGAQCGRFAPAVCALYQQASAGGALTPAFAALLARSSPATVLSQLHAPALLTQGEQDSLFDLAQADANAREIKATGTPVTVRWRSGGHDTGGGGDEATALQRAFFDKQLRGKGSFDSADFKLDELDSAISTTTGERVTTTLTAGAGYSGLAGASQTSLVLQGPTQTIAAPAGGQPAAVTSIPGLGSVLGVASVLGAGGFGAAQLPGQVAAFVSPPLQRSTLIAGASSVSLTFTATTDVTAFVSVRDVAPDGAQTLPAQLVSPIRLNASIAPIHTTVRLPAVVVRVPAGHRLAVVVSTTDFGYAMPTAARTYTVAASSALSIATVSATRASSGTAGWVITAVVVLVLTVLLVGLRLRSRRRGSHDPALAHLPVVVSDLVKEYADGYRAVNGVSFTVERGQVLGLLGPNGAGKTTTLRVLMGLILPTQGTVRVFGDEVVPGAPALARLGAFVEGPGLLPHLSGAENLRLYWAASGRPTADAELDTVLQIAGLGASLERRVKTYSHGMQQRLAIAQAMLGLPEVLVLDEPTNGLDPPQIAEMRHVLHRYAATGRTVIVSSHLLAEVEQTCTHVVVMHRGRLVAAGSVDEVAGGGGIALVVDDPDRARSLLVAAGMTVTTAATKRALEDVFLDLIGERHD
jgi:ABC-2 type transport system ATP-binding protein